MNRPLKFLFPVLDRLIGVVSLSSAILLLASCGSSSFTGSAKNKSQLTKKKSTTEEKLPTDNETNGLDSQVAGSLTESFDLGQKGAGMVDILWVIDNSGSMRDEANKVAANLNAFLTETRQKVAQGNLIKVGLITGTLGSQQANNTITNVYAPAVPWTTEQLKQWGADFVQQTPVGSTNGMELAAIALCEASSSADPFRNIVNAAIAGTNSVSPVKVCNTTEDLAKRAESPFVATNLPGSARSFLRDKAKLVVVFVTDDNAVNVTDKNFLSLLAKGNQTNVPTVHTFGALNDSIFYSSANQKSQNPSCQVARKSEAYLALSKSTGGEFFDICENDWKPHFAKLTENVVTLSKSSFALSQAVGKVLSVNIDGVKLQASQYSLSGQTLVLGKDQKVEGKQKISVTYQPLAKSAGI